jgi:DNA-binding response OmpR family regulator
MEKDFFNIIVCSADDIRNEALQSLITSINCNAIIMNDYDTVLEKLENEDIKAIVVDEYIFNKGQIVSAQELFKKYTYKAPIIFLLETLNGTQEHHPYKHYFRKPINAKTLKNYLSPYLEIKEVVKVKTIKIGNFNFDKNLNLLIDQKKNIIELTPIESRLLLTFFENLNKVLNEEFLLKNVWGYSAQANSNTIKTHIWRLRKKISKKSKTSFDLETSNKGYVLKNDDKPLIS